MCYQKYLKYCGGSSVAPFNDDKLITNEGAYVRNPSLSEQ